MYDLLQNLGNDFGSPRDENDYESEQVEVRSGEYTWEEEKIE